jgi:hypothetical protein
VAIDMKNTVTKKIPLVVLGTSLFAPDVTDLAEDTGRYDATAFIENHDCERTREPFLGRRVIWIDDAIERAATHQAVCSLGTTHRKSFIEPVASVGFQFARIQHPGPRVSGTSAVGDGSVLSVGVIVAAHTHSAVTGSSMAACSSDTTQPFTTT